VKTAYNTFLYQMQDGIATVTLNRPERLNAISLEMVRELRQLVAEIEREDEPRVIIFTGAPRPDGRPCFSAGADLKELPTVDFHMFQVEINYVFNRITDLSKPTIGAIDGICTAGGLELALTLDIRVASETAEIRDLHMKTLGYLGGSLQTWLPRVVGTSKAKEIAWTGEVLDGKEAWRIGLANRVFPPEKLMEETRGLAARIAAMRPLALKWSKNSFNASLELQRQESLHYDDFCRSMVGPPVDAAIDFAKKRPPSFRD
jgi:enoyl-CoA hydratase/carnithine racemase